MPIYEYQALTDAGRSTGGVIDADTARDARAKLRAMRLHPMRVRETGTAPPAPSAAGAPPAAGGARERLDEWRRLLARRRIGDLPLLTRQLATLLKAGIPLVDALTALIEQMEEPETEKVFRLIRERIRGGASLADAIAERPDLFGDLYVNMVRAGEASGTLDTVLSDLADFTHRQHALRGKVAAALAYPAVLVCVACGVVAFMLGKVIPTLEQVLLAQGKELPLATQILVGASGLFRDGWWAMLIAGIATVTGGSLFVARPAGRLFWDRAKLQLPLIGPILKKQAVARFASTLGTLLKSGIPAVEALRITRNVVDNALLARTLDTVANKIVEGEDIATPLKRSGLFPAVLSYMIAIGEQSGQLEEILRTVSAAYAEEVELALQKFTAMLEPILIVAMAGGVGFIVFSIVKPILEMSQLQ